MAAKLFDYGTKENGQRLLGFFCPGCGYGHSYEVPRWHWNGSMESPTFSPSLLVNESIPEARCHLHVTDGKIAYCGDCHHEMRGQTVEMEEYKQ